jgi:hypothetical protein
VVILNRLTGGGNLTPLVPITMQEMKPSVTSSGVLDSSISPYQGNFSRWLSARTRDELSRSRVANTAAPPSHSQTLLFSNRTRTRIFQMCVVDRTKQSFNWPALFACPLLRLSSHCCFKMQRITCDWIARKNNTDCEID